MVLYNAQLYTMSDGILSDGWVRFENGLIVALGEANTAPTPTADDIDCQGQPVTPGLVDAHCHIGMMGDSLGFEATDDANEWGDPVSPHVRALDAINPMDRTFEDAVRGGVTTVCVGPGSGNPIGGQVSVLKTVGNQVDSMLLLPTAAIKIAFGENPRLHGKKGHAPYTRMAAAAMIREALLTAQDYQQHHEHFNMKSEALLPVLAKRMPFHAHCHRASDIFTALRIAQEFAVDIVLVHATEAHLIASALAAANVPIITGPSMLTRAKPELTNISFQTPVTLSQHGLRPSICTDAPETSIDYLPLCAALAVKAGMSPYEALRAITWYPATTLGVGHRVGALRPGMEADIVLWTEHPLLLDSRPQTVWSSGTRVFS